MTTPTQDVLDAANAMTETSQPTIAVASQVAVEKKFLDWGILSEAKTELLYFEKYGMYAEYKTMIPVDQFAEIEAKLTLIKDERQKVKQRTVEILKAVMVNPPVTDETARAVLKADSGVVYAIIGKVMSNEQNATKTAVTGE